jgi:cephalosporin hydroxylase
MTADANPGGLPTGDELKRAAEALAAEVEDKIGQRQNGLPTFFDNFVRGVIAELRLLDPARPWEETAQRLSGPQGERLRARLALLRRVLAGRGGRRVDYLERSNANPGTWPSAIDPDTLTMSQGTAECLHWRGRPLFKTVFDFALVPMMLWDLRPATVIELGSGNGASALWMADLMASFGIDSRVYSLDLEARRLAHERVTFMAGDCNAIAAAFPAEFLNPLAHPWLVVEDAHVNVPGVLAHFHPFLAAGDVLYVEDSLTKRRDLARFTAEFAGAYKVDTRYTDFFGRNATCAVDSILVRV